MQPLLLDTQPKCKRYVNYYIDVRFNSLTLPKHTAVDGASVSFLVVVGGRMDVQGGLSAQ
jgi:hypothetical protein